MKNKISSEMNILDVIHKYPQTADVLLKMSMACGGCGLSHYETVEQGAIAHGILPSNLVKELNEAIV